MQQHPTRADVIAAEALSDRSTRDTLRELIRANVAALPFDDQATMCDLYQSLLAIDGIEPP